MWTKFCAQIKTQFLQCSFVLLFSVVILFSLLSSWLTCLLIVLHTACSIHLFIFHHLFRSGSRCDLLPSHVLQLFWGTLRLIVICNPLCMFWVCPQGVLPVWRVQEASRSDAQTTSAGSFHCKGAAMCHQTGHTSPSTDESGQNPCFLRRLTVSQSWD